MRTLSCIGPQAKSAIAEEIGRAAITETEKVELNQFLKTFPTCGTGIPIEIGEVQTGKKGKRAKRAPSAYNLFIGQCMKGKKIKAFGEASGKMKECASEWRQRKGT